MAKKWIAEAVKHRGALHRSLGLPSGEKIPKGVLEKAEKMPGKIGKEARLAETLSKLHKRGSRA